MARGAKLESTCATCGTANQPGARFCKKCGTRIAAASAPAKPAAASTVSAIRVTSEQPDAATPLDGERKTVTALFADIKGSTALMEGLDPEAAHAIVEPVLRLMIEAVHRYEGYVVRTAGDGIFALFGAPVAHEDHPQRALYAALRLQEELKTELAETDFREAIALAQKMQAKAWELRATTSLARLLAKQGRRDEARTMLATIYGWFTEGFDTADLIDAKALLDELSA
jgi:hypothetical protein